MSDLTLTLSRTLYLTLALTLNIVSYGIDALIAVMNINIVLSQSLLQVVFRNKILDLLQLCH